MSRAVCVCVCVKLFNKTNAEQRERKKKNSAREEKEEKRRKTFHLQVGRSKRKFKNRQREAAYRGGRTALCKR